jgi:subtilisin family serine protease
MKKLNMFVFLLGFASLAEAYRIIPNRYIVRLKNDYARMSRQNIYRSFAGSVQGMRTLTRTGEFLLVSRGQGRSFNRARVLADIDAIKQNPMVAYVEPDSEVRINSARNVPNDPQFGKLWGLENTANPGVDIQARKAWTLTTGSDQVVVAVIDTGTSALADLKDNLWVNEKEKNGKPGVDDDGNGYVDDIHGYDFVNNDGDPSDDHGHGSHCAGTIGASGNNGKDIVGVAWKVKIMPLKFLSARGSGSLSDAIRAIDYGTMMGAQILSNSWGGGRKSSALEEAITKANNKNILFVAAAGNSRQNMDKRPSYPASYEVDNVVAVAALEKSGGLASFSNYGATTVHVAAPGKDILSTTPGGLKSWSGTSMAAPHVSGIAALILSHPGAVARGVSRIKPKAMRDLLIKTSTPLPKVKGKVISGGITNAYKALKQTTFGRSNRPW